MASEKISEMIGATDINDADLITIVQDGTNKKIAKSDFVDDLGATGTIVQSGSATGTPVLETSGTINSIRNVENGSGVKASISAENGLKLEHNLTFDTTGIPITGDATVLSPIMRSMSAGAGISITDVGNTIQVSAVSGGGSSRTVIVSQLSDFPAAVSGVITLEANKNYKLINDITTPSRFVMADQSSIEGDGVFGLTLTYTGTGVMLSSVDSSVSLPALRVDCPSGTLFGISNPVALDSAVVFTSFVVVSANSLGTISDVSSLVGDAFGVLSTANGFTFGGSNTFCHMTAFSIVLTSGTALNLGTSTWSAFNIANGMIHGSGVFLSGLASSGNIKSGGSGIISGMSFGAGITPVSTISPDDDYWWFALNAGIRDTHPGGYLHMQGNSTNSVISSVGVAVLVAGSWTVGEASQATATTAGRMTYSGAKDADMGINATLTMEPASGGSQLLSFYIAINGSTVAGSKRSATLSAAGSVSGVWDYNFTAGDYVEIFVANDSATNDILVSSAIMRVH